MSLRSRRLRCMLPLFLLLACGAAEDDPDAVAEQARAAAVAALDSGRPADALAAIEKFRANRPDTADALLEYATLLVQAGEAAEVRWLLEAAVERFPDRHDLKLALANVAMLVNDPAQAERVAASIPADAEQAVGASLVRSRAALKLGDTDRALEILRDAETRFPERAELRLPRIAALLEERRFDDARAAISEADEEITSTEGRTALRRLRTTVFAAQAAEGDVDGALSGLTALVETAPDDPMLWNALVQLQLRAGRGESARARLTEALAQDPERLFLYSLLAAVEASLGNARAAEDWLRTLVERSPSPTAHLALARLQIAAGNPAAIAGLDDALREYPDHALLQTARIEALLAFERNETARTELAALRVSRAHDPVLEVLAARLELVDGRPEAAVARLREVVPRLDHASTQFWLGRALEESGDTSGALRRYGLAWIRNPADPAAALAIVRLSMLRGDWRNAASHAQRLLQRSPGVAAAWDALTAALIELAEGDAALPIAEQARAAFPDRVESHIHLAAALRAVGRFAEAIETLRAAAEQFGATAMIAAETAVTFARMRNFDAGMAAVRAGQSGNPDSAVLLHAEATLHFLAGDAGAGTRATDRALALDPGDLRPLRGRAEFRAAIGDLPAARADCEVYLAARPDDARIHFVLGSVLAGLGEPDAAIAAYRRAAELDSNAVAPRNNLAELLAAHGDIDGALDAAQQAFAIASDDPFVLDTLGALYLRKGLTERSISLLEEAHTLAPELPDASLHLAQAYLDVGRGDAARDLLLALQADASLPPALRSEVAATLARVP